MPEGQQQNALAGLPDDQQQAPFNPSQFTVPGVATECHETHQGMRGDEHQHHSLLSIWRNSPVCRHPIQVSDIVLEACIDSGATVCLMSRKAYRRIRHVVGPLVESDKRACGANGNSLDIDGYV